MATGAAPPTNSPAAPSLSHPQALHPLTLSALTSWRKCSFHTLHFANTEPNLRHLENPNVMESKTRPQPDLSAAAVLAVAMEGHVLFRAAKIFTNPPPGNVPATAGKAPLTSDICVLIAVQQLWGDLHLCSGSSISSMLIQTAEMVETSRVRPNAAATMTLGVADHRCVNADGATPAVSGGPRREAAMIYAGVPDSWKDTF